MPTQTLKNETNTSSSKSLLPPTAFTLVLNSRHVSPFPHPHHVYHAHPHHRCSSTRYLFNRHHEVHKIRYSSVTLLSPAAHRHFIWKQGQMSIIYGTNTSIYIVCIGGQGSLEEEEGITGWDVSCGRSDEMLVGACFDPSHRRKITWMRMLRGKVTGHKQGQNKHWTPTRRTTHYLPTTD